MNTLNLQYNEAATKENGKYYPLVYFHGSGCNGSYYLNEPQETRAKALTIARKKIRELKKKL